MAENVIGEAEEAVADVLELSEEHIKELAAELEYQLSLTGAQIPYFWAILTFIFLVAAFVGIRTLLFGTLKHLIQNTDTDVDDFISNVLKAFTKPLQLVVTAAFISTNVYPLTPLINYGIRVMFTVVTVFKLLSAVMKTIRFIIENDVILDDDKDKETKNMVHNLEKTVKLILWVAGSLFLLDNVGFDITSIVAGLGIGGIAIALATQAVLADAFNSFVIFFDKPFKVGDCVTVGGTTGHVQHIGFKTTKVRALTGELVVYPNSTIANSTLQNFSSATVQNRDLVVGIDNDTPNELVREFPKVVFAAVDSVDKVTAVQVYFREFGTYTLNFHVRYSVASTNPDVHRDCLGEVNTCINEAAKKLGVSFPYPTTRLRVHPDHLNKPVVFEIGK